MAKIWKPHKYQTKAVKWLLKHPNAALLLSPGLGKSAIALAAFQLLQDAGKAKRALIVAPLRVCQMVWTHDEGGELSKWKQFKDLSVTLLHGPKKDELIEEISDLYIINYDGLRWLIESGHIKTLCKRGVDTLMFDEISKLKRPSTKRYKALKPFLGRFKRRWGLTGSPASNGLLDLFGQAYVLDLGKSLGRYITHYRYKYFMPTGYGGYTWVLQDGAEKKIHKAMKNLAISMKAEDHLLDLPKLVEQNIWVDLPPKARKIYDDLEEDFIAALDEGLVTAANAAVASSKCRQVASGGVYQDKEFDVRNPYKHLGDFPNHIIPKRKRPVAHIHDEKTNTLIDLVDELQGNPLLVAYEYHHDLERIRKALGKDTPAINGKTTAKQCSELVLAWNAGELPILCGHPAAMGHGLNLQDSGHHIAWYSPTWNYELYVQTIGRVWRQGSKAKRVMVHRILARKTVDQIISQTLTKKKRTQDNLFEALKTYRRSKAHG